MSLTAFPRPLFAMSFSGPCTTHCRRHVCMLSLQKGEHGETRANKEDEEKTKRGRKRRRAKMAKKSNDGQNSQKLSPP